jgi:hypothetical protein
MSLQREVEQLEAVHLALLFPALASLALVPVLVHAREVVLLVVPRNWIITMVYNPERKTTLWGIPI